MKRIPPYVIVALCGLAFISAGLLGMFADNTTDTTAPAEGGAPVVEEVLPTPTMTVEVVQEVVAPPVVSAPLEAAPPVAAQPVVVEPPVVAPVEVVPTEVVPPPVEVQPIPTALDVVPTVEVPAQPAPVDAAPTAVIPAESTPVVEVPAPPEVVPADASDQSSRDVPAAPPDAGAPTLSAPVKPVPTAITEIEPTAVIVPEQPLPVDPTQIAPVIVPTVEIVAPTSLPADAVVAPAATTAQITGLISFPDAQDYTGITVMLTLPDGTQLQNLTGAAGTFEFLNLKSGSYRVVASAQGYLSRQLDFTLADGQAMALPPTFLVAGDTNFDNIIDLNDAALVASNFDGPATVQTADPNRDGWVDVRDLALIGADFGLTGPIPWQ
jgi:carboxypeptidase family protein